MTMAESELRHVVPELHARLVGQRVANVWQPARDSVVIGFQDGTRLLLVPRGPDARLHTIVRKATNPPRPFSFQGACRAHLTGPLLALRQLQGERVVDLDFGTFRLHLRLTGRSGGLWLVEVRESGDRLVAAYDGPAPSELPPLPALAPLDHTPRFGPDADGSWDASAARWFAARIRERASRELRADVDRLLSRAITREARRLANLEGDLLKAEGADLLREQADTLAAHLHEVVQGADHVDLPAWDDPERVLRVPLEPDKSPARSMDRLYNRARRLDRMGERVLERLDGVVSDLQALRATHAGLDGLDAEALQALRATYAQREATRNAPMARSGITTWIGPRGQRVLVGRDARANRQLTFQVARGTDWWMHIRGKPGAHIVLPMPRDQSPSLDVLLAAAQIALLHAGMSAGEKAEVQYTRARDVKSIPGSDGAQVLVHGETVLFVARDPEALTSWERQE